MIIDIINFDINKYRLVYNRLNNFLFYTDWDVVSVQLVYVTYKLLILGN